MRSLYNIQGRSLLSQNVQLYGQHWAGRHACNAIMLSDGPMMGRYAAAC